MGIFQKIKNAAKEFFKENASEQRKDDLLKYKFYMKAGTFKIGALNGEGFVITADENTPLYYIRISRMMENHKMFLYDASRKRIGVVKKKFFTVPNILEGEHKTKKCIIKINDKTSTVTTFKTGKSRCFKTTGLGIQITCDALRTKFTFSSNAGPKTKIHMTSMGIHGKDYLISHETENIDPVVFMIMAAIELMLYH